MLKTHMDEKILPCFSSFATNAIGMRVVSCEHYVTPRPCGDCAKRTDARCHPSRKFTRLHPCFPDHSCITFSTSAPLAIIQSSIRPRCPWQIHGLFANARSAENSDSAHVEHLYIHIHTHAHIHARGVGSNVAFYEPPTSELGQPRPRVSQPWKQEFSGSNGNPRDWYRKLIRVCL